MLLFSVFTPSQAAVSRQTDAQVWQFTAAPEKAAYEAGEEIRIKAALTNVSFASLQDAEIWMYFEKSNTYLVSGDVWYALDVLETGKTWDRTFNLFENTDNQAAGERLKTALGEKPGGMLARILQFFGNLFSNLSPFLRHVEDRWKTAFDDVPESFAGLFLPHRCRQVGACKVSYGGQEIGCTFYLRYRQTKVPAPAAAVKAGDKEGANALCAVLTPSADSISGAVFGAEFTDGGFEGGFFFLNEAENLAGLARMENGAPQFLAVKYADLTPGEEYPVKVLYDGSRLIAWLYNDPLDPDPYPLFDVPFVSDKTGYGICGEAKDVTLAGAAAAAEGETYQNPLYPNSADPFVLYEDGVYYLYATNNGEGFNAAISTDLVHWTDIGQVAFRADIVGDNNFWAPEVYKYNGRFYLFYSAEGHLAVAVADSPAGPFVKTADTWLLERDAIDGHVFFDDDGRIWLYLVHFDSGNHIWVYELNDDLVSVKPGSGVKLTFPEGWEGRINEGPTVLKHNGTYYLTYSGDDYQTVNYAVAYMTSQSPTGPFTRYVGNPMLRPDTFIHGTGHHCFTTSPDGSEMFIVYHCHNTLAEVHPRALCIDRVKFVPQPDGTDRLVAYGPTTTPQPMPK